MKKLDQRAITTAPYEFMLKIRSSVGGDPKRYSWVEVYRNPGGKWAETGRAGDADDDPAYEVNNSTAAAGQVYRAFRDPRTSHLIFSATGGGGAVDVKIDAKDLILLILGTEEQYDSCPDAPPPSPKCWQAYAWAAYKVCGYKYRKVMDARTIKQWALELNGGTTGGFRRFHPAYWGWDDPNDPSTGPCAGVRFLATGVGALSCPCPDWIQPVKCFKISVKYKRAGEVPCPPEPARCNCNSTFWTNFTNAMASYWGTTQTSTLCVTAGACVWQGDNGPFTFTLAHQEIPLGEPECFWGPAEIDPCEPCEGFGQFRLGVNIGAANGGAPGSNNFGAYKVDQAVIRGLVSNCASGPVTLAGEMNHDDAACPNPIAEIRLECCSPEQIQHCIDNPPT